MKFTESTKTAWLVMMMDFFHYVAFMCTKPYLKGMLTDAHVSDEVAGVILAIFSLIQVLNAIILGKWIQKKGQKPQLITGAAMYLIAGVLLAFAPSVCGFADGVSGYSLGAAAADQWQMFGSSVENVVGGNFDAIGSAVLNVSTVDTNILGACMLTLCVLLLGTSHGIFLICGHYVITGIPKEEGRDKYVGYLTFINSIGQFVAPVVAAMLLVDTLIASSFSGRYFYVMILSVVASGISLALACIIRNVRGGKTKEPAKVGTVLRDRPLMKIVFLNAAVYFAVDVVSTYTQEFGEKTLMLTAAKATLIMAAMKFSAIFVRAFLGFLTKLVGSARLLRISLFVVAASIVGMGFTAEIAKMLSGLGLPYEGTKFVVIMFMSLLFGLANGLVNPLALIELSNASNSSNRSPALALRNMGNSGGQTIGEVAFGFLAGAFGTLSPVFLVSGTILFGCYLLSFDRKKKGVEVTKQNE